MPTFTPAMLNAAADIFGYTYELRLEDGMADVFMDGVYSHTVAIA